jgi:DNA-directed RNA polymerase subunit RPC12/RpoP
MMKVDLSVDEIEPEAIYTCLRCGIDFKGSELIALKGKCPKCCSTFYFKKEV